MVFARGPYIIEVNVKYPTLGKRPELYIGYGNELVKVASFASVEKGEAFDKFLYFFLQPDDDDLRRDVNTLCQEWSLKKV